MNRVWLIVLGDLVAFFTTFIVILYIRFGDSSFQAALGTHAIPFIILYLSWVLSFFLFGLYDLYSIKPTIPHLWRFSLALITSLIIGILLFYLVPIFGITPKTNLLFQVVGFGLLSFLLRRFVYVVFSQQITRPGILVGVTPYLEELHQTIIKNPQIGLNVISYTNDLHESLKKYSHITNAVFIIEGMSNKIPRNDIVTLYKNKTEIIDIAQAYERYLYKIPVDCISQSWIIENINTKGNIGYNFLTRLMDVVFSIIIFILSSPLWILGALCVYVYDRGTIFYIQKRVGLNGKVFKLYKLRSMIIESEKNGAVWSTKDDDRITPIGRILRKLHIDELPQMINIIKGDLSLVGPRPERPHFVEQLEGAITHYELRHIIKPGFTGWAQIKYHYANTVEGSKEKFEYDLYYIKNRNIFLDLGIIARTVQIIFTN